MTRKIRPSASGLAMMMAAAMLPATAAASSHREAPLISEDPSADNADLYAFTSPDRPDTLTIIATYIGLEEPGGGPNWLRFSDDVLYEIKIDNNGDGRANDVVYEFRFNTRYNPGMAMGVGGATGPAGTFFYNVGQIDGIPTASNFHAALVAQSMEVTRVADGRRTNIGTNLPVAPVYVGRFAYGTGGRPAADDANYTRIWEQAISNLGSSGAQGRVFAGPTDDPFFVDLGSVFDDVTFRDSVMGFGSRGGGYDYVAGYNVHTIALQLPISEVVRAMTPSDINNPGNVVGIYATASRPRVTLRRNCRNTSLLARTPFNFGCQDSYGQFVQVSRLGIPLVNEVLIPLALKDAWNAAAPIEDASIFGQFILSPSLPTYAQVLYGPMGLRAAAGYMAPTRPVMGATLMNNDMLALVTGAPGLVPGVPMTGFTPADLLRINVRTPSSALPTGVGNPTLAMGRSRLAAAGGDTQGFPNGRRLFDDVVDIEERFVLNTLGRINNIPFGDGVDGNDVPYRTSFPYVPIPLRGDGLIVHRQEPPRSM